MCSFTIFLLIDDDFDEGYFGEGGDGDSDDGPAPPPVRRAEQKRVHIMGMLN